MQRGCNQLDVSGLFVQLRSVGCPELVRSDPGRVSNPSAFGVILDEQLDCTNGYPLMPDREKKRIIIHGRFLKGPAVFDVVPQR